MNYIKDLKLNNNLYKDTFNAIIEIPKGSKIKSELEDGSFDKLIINRKIKLSYPFYYGCFPETLAGDNDPLDMVLLTNKKYNQLDVVEVMLIGVLKTIDNNEIDDKIFVIPADEEISNIDKLINKALDFLSKYKGKKANMKIEGYFDKLEADHIVLKAHKDYLNKYKTNKNLKVDF